MNLKQFLSNNNINITEGHIGENEELSNELKKIIYKQFIDLNSPNILKCMEIGFNGGHSAEIFLSSFKNTHLISFDIGTHDYVYKSKQYIDEKYPNQHKLVIGNSNDTIPIFIQNNPDLKFDIIFIDGSHNFDIVIKDMENCMNLCHKDTIIIMDDTMYKKDWVKSWNIAPNLVWDTYKINNKIIEMCSIDVAEGRGMSYGKFN